MVMWFQIYGVVWNIPGVVDYSVWYEHDLCWYYLVWYYLYDLCWYYMVWYYCSLHGMFLYGAEWWYGMAWLMARV